MTNMVLLKECLNDIYSSNTGTLKKSSMWKTKCNTNVTLVSAYSLTISWLIIDPKRLFELTNSKKTRDFMFLMCRYGYYEKTDKNSKYEHESGKGIKSRGWEAFFKS